MSPRANFTTAGGDGRTAIIVGAGIGGLTAAIALRRTGWQVTVLERAVTQSKVQVGSGLTVWSNAVRVLDGLGLGTKVRAIGAELEHFENRLANGRVLASWPVGEWGRELECPSLNVSRQELHSLLAAHVDGNDVEWGTTCHAVRQDGRGAIVTLDRGEERLADLVVGADGLNSAVRTLLLADGPPRYAGYAVWRAIVEGPAPTIRPGTFVQVWGRGARFGWYRLTDDRVYWFAVANAAEARDRTQGAVGHAAEVRSRFANWPDPVRQLVDAAPDHAISRVNTYDRDPASRWGTGAVTLLGDAAHPMTFNVGQGACQAIEDGAALATSLAQRPGDVDAALRGYESERMARTAPMMRRARTIGALGRWHNPVGCAVRGRLLRPVLSGPAARQAKAMTSHRCADVPVVPVPAPPLASPSHPQPEGSHH